MLPFDHRHLETRIFILGGDAPRAAQDTVENRADRYYGHGEGERRGKSVRGIASREIKKEQRKEKKDEI